MNRPWEVTFLGCLFVGVGVVGLVAHGWHAALDRLLVLMVLVQVIAIVGGVFLIRGNAWARWVLLAWLALHVGIGAMNSWQEAAAHLVLLLVIACFLLRPPASSYFKATSTS